MNKIDEVEESFGFGLEGDWKIYKFCMDRVQLTKPSEIASPARIRPTNPDHVSNGPADKSPDWTSLVS